MTLGLSSYEARFRWLAIIWVVLMTIWVMCPLAWQTRLIGAAIWLGVTLAISLLVAWWRPRSSRDVPVFLCLRNVADAPIDAAHPEATISPKTLETLIIRLKAANYRLMTASEAIAAPDQKAVVLTFDGGSRDAFFNLFPILKKHHAKATCFVPALDPQNVDHLKSLEIQEMVRSGLVEIGSTVTTEQATSATLPDDIRRTRNWMTGVLGHLPTLFSLPIDVEAEAIRAAALSAGYKYLFSAGKYMRPVAEAPDDIRRRVIPGNRRPLQIYLLATRGRYRVGSTAKQAH
ncbi:MAG: polysaccharide deacetylase family protein [Kiritimatiellae bacterium]|nr:polysaccharide deacetylase family protein [Kiritimatiellia bacterium]